MLYTDWQRGNTDIAWQTVENQSVNKSDMGLAISFSISSSSKTKEIYGWRLNCYDQFTHNNKPITDFLKKPTTNAEPTL